MNEQSKILIVDDESFNQEHIDQELQDSSYQLMTASNGWEALDEMQDEHPDLVLQDYLTKPVDVDLLFPKVKEYLG